MENGVLMAKPETDYWSVEHTEISKTMAKCLFNNGCKVYRLYSSGKIELITNIGHINKHKEIFGVDKND